MATFLCNQSPLVSCPCSTSFTSRPSQSPQPQILHLSSLSHPHLPRPHLSAILGFPKKLFPLSCANRRTLFKSCLASQDSHQNTNDEMEDTENDVRLTDDKEDQKPLPRLMVLIEAYKEAILNRDEKTAFQIEERIYSMENKQNELIQKVSTLSAEKDSSKKTYLRTQADFDNFRKRFEKERLNIQSKAHEQVIEKLLSLVDSFERAKQQTKAVTEKEKKIDASYQGLYKQFVEIMRSHQVSVVATVGKPFNPLLHEAIGREESQEFKEGIIIKESRRGFMLRDRVLRPALVKVSSGPGNKKSTGAPNKSKEQPSATAGKDER